MLYTDREEHGVIFRWCGDMWVSEGTRFKVYLAPPQSEEESGWVLVGMTAPMFCRAFLPDPLEVDEEEMEQIAFLVAVCVSERGGLDWVH